MFRRVPSIAEPTLGTMVDGIMWQSLIVDDDRRAAIASVIVSIVEGVEIWRQDNPTTIDDDADYATLRFYAAADGTVPDPKGDTACALEDAINKLGDTDQPELYGGAARVAFVVSHLSAGEDSELACEMIERALLKSLAQPTEIYDLLSGLVGIAVPVLQLIANGKSSPSSEPLARNILDQLERLARPMETGIAWHTPPDQIDPRWLSETPNGHTNLGLAHGVAGVIAILARYIVIGIDTPRVQVLLENAVAYLRSVAGPQAGRRYPPWLPAPLEWPSYAAWCYGDLGIAVALMSAAIATGRDDWRDDALELAHSMATRPFEPSQVVDAGLCHGTAGIAHLFNRLAQATGDSELARAADEWFVRTLAGRGQDAIAGFPKRVRSDDAIAGFPKTGSEGLPKWRPDATLLSGASGVGLALHAAISRIEPAWDQLLLTDLPPRGSL